MMQFFVLAAQFWFYNAVAPDQRADLFDFHFVNAIDVSDDLDGKELCLSVFEAVLCLLSAARLCGLTIFLKQLTS